MRDDEKIRRWELRFEAVKSKVADLGLLLTGTITPRMDRRPDPRHPRCMIERGPYYQWTFKEKGKTRTVNLSAQQAKVFGRAIRNQRKLEEIMLEMRDLSLKILQAQTVGVRKRRSAKPDEG